MRIIGIDPGSRYTGYGIIEKRGNALRHIASGRVNATRAGEFNARLAAIYAALTELLDEFPCEAAACESIFTSRNAMSTIKLGHARGVALLALQHASLDVCEYAPTRVKQSITGHGRSTKAGVAAMVARTLSIDESALSEDASDALAVAICHAFALDFTRRLDPSSRESS